MGTCTVEHSFDKVIVRRGLTTGQTDALKEVRRLERPVVDADASVAHWIAWSPIWAGDITVQRHANVKKYLAHDLAPLRECKARPSRGSGTRLPQ
jgi:hypothetical protein